MRSIATLFVVVLVSGCATASPAAIGPNPTPADSLRVRMIAVPAQANASGPGDSLKFVQFKDNQFVLMSDFDFVFQLQNRTVRVPSGFVTDFASIPRVVARVFRKDPHQIPGLVHDYLYWTQRCERGEADKMFLVALRQLGNTNVKAGMMYLGVRIGGKKAWNDNGDERKSSLPRIIPTTGLGEVSNTLWGDYRSNLRGNVLLDDPGPRNPEYCEAGRTRATPSN